MLRRMMTCIVSAQNYPRILLQAVSGLSSFQAPLALNRPDFTLPLAYAEAVARLRLSDAVNHAPKDDDLYCVSAKLSTNIAASGEWTFEFSGTNSSRRLVVVTKNGEFFKTMVSRPQP